MLGSYYPVFSTGFTQMVWKRNFASEGPVKTLCGQGNEGLWRRKPRLIKVGSTVFPLHAQCIGLGDGTKDFILISPSISGVERVPKFRCRIPLYISASRGASHDVGDVMFFDNPTV